MRFLPLASVRLHDGPFLDALRTDLTYALSLDDDRLLAPFLEEAGLPSPAARYGNWESIGLDGHIGGHQLSALSHLHAATGDPEPLNRVNRMVAALQRAQAASGTGYVGGVPGGRAVFERLSTGGAEASRALSGGEHWVPWYNLHKTFQGLIDAHLVAGNADALAVVTALADWWLDLASGIDDDVFELMLDTEFGGMNEAYALLAKVTGRTEYGWMARRFSHRRILDPLLEHRDTLTGLHANTQIPKAVGYAETGAVTGDPALLDAADVFWRTVVDHRSVAIGGNSVREHFHDAGDFTPMIEDREGPEFCNTYNMLKLTRALAQHELRPEYLDYAERALYNHVLGSQHPDGGFVYFTPMRPRHYRVYSQPELAFWCCVGTGLEAQARTAEWIFGVEDDAVLVNLYVPAEARVDELGARVRIETGFPQSPAVRIQVDVDSDREFDLRLRVPGWANGLDRLEVNGEPAIVRPEAGAVVLRRRWRSADVVSFGLPLGVRAERLPDGSAWQAYLAGPVVLAARAGTHQLDGLHADDGRYGQIARGPLLTLADVPLVEPGAAGVEHQGELRYHVASSDGEPIELEPFAGIHDERYTVYWPIADGDGAEQREQLRALDLAVTDDQATTDVVALGEQQPEADHDFRGVDAETVTVDDRRWRVTSGTMTVRLAVSGATLLRVTYRVGTEPTGVIVRLGGAVVAHERYEALDTSFDADYPIGRMLTAMDDPESVELSFTAPPGLTTPGIGSVRTLR
jgi:DUF1680 family protein